MDELLPRLEAVYYGSPIPLSNASLTLLGLVFDRLHFPNVHLPTDGYEVEEVSAEADRIERLGLRDYGSVVLASALKALPHVQSLKEFCVFTGNKAQLFGGIEEKQTAEL